MQTWLRAAHTSFAYLVDLDNVYILLDKDNDLEEEHTHLLNEVGIFISSLKKQHNQSGFKHTQTLYRHTG